MNHYLPISLLASTALLLCGCSDENRTAEELLPTSAIRFSPSLLEEESGRGTVTDNTLLQTGGFGVMGYLHTTGAVPNYSAVPNFMNNQPVTYNGGSAEWTYSPLKYWPANSNDRLDFLAYAPYDPTNIQVNGSTLTFTVNADPDQQTDLVVAAPKKNVHQANASTGIQFTFSHLLSRIEFSATSADGTTPITVHSISLTGNFSSSGTVDLSSDAPCIIGGTPTERTYTLTGGMGCLFLIPTSTATPSATVRYTAGEETTEKTIPLTTTSFAAGKSYHINLQIDTGNATNQ